MPAWLPRAIRLAIAYVLVTLAALWFLGRARDLLGWLLLAAFFSLALEPGVNALHDRGWPRGRATALLLVSGLGFFLALGLMVIPIMVDNIGEIADNVPTWIDEANSYSQPSSRWS